MLSEREFGLLVQRPTDRDQLGLERSAVPDELLEHAQSILAPSEP